MTRFALLVGFLVALLSAAELTAQEAPNLSRVEFADSGPGFCPPNHWCLDLLVLDADSLHPLQATNVTVSACGAFLSDQSGSVHVQCAQPGLVNVQVRQIGFQPATGSAEVRLGHRYRVTVRLAVPDFITRDVFGLGPLCYHPDWGVYRRCLTRALTHLEDRLAQELATAREATDAPALLDSAQAAWLRYRAAHCAARAELQKDRLPLPLGQLRCDVDVTEERVNDLGFYWIRKEW